MLRPQGYLQVIDPDCQTVERDTITCGHCQRVVFTKPGTASTVYLIPAKPRGPHDLDALKRQEEVPGAFCRVCMRSVCLQCHDLGTCRPAEKFLEQVEKAGRRNQFLRSVGL